MAELVNCNEENHSAQETYGNDLGFAFDEICGDENEVADNAKIKPRAVENLD